MLLVHAVPEEQTVNASYEGESIKNQPNLFLGEIDLFFSDVNAL